MSDRFVITCPFCLGHFLKHKMKRVFLHQNQIGLAREILVPAGSHYICIDCKESVLKVPLNKRHFKEAPKSCPCCGSTDPDCGCAQAIGSFLQILSDVDQRIKREKERSDEFSQ